MRKVTVVLSRDMADCLGKANGVKYNELFGKTMVKYIATNLVDLYFNLLNFEVICQYNFR